MAHDAFSAGAQASLLLMTQNYYSCCFCPFLPAGIFCLRVNCQNCLLC
ncbi:hypothetical protein KCP74_21090 [Salmonella enterica subsp. enterica]|nr:hypothetical protein KCP74_21090 [Salmonella enterica subsp. enterica]